MSKIVELSIGEIENVVGGVGIAASANRYPAPTNMNTSMNRLPTHSTSMNQAPPPRPPRPAPIR